jgi:hypothetical protein
MVTIAGRWSNRARYRVGVLRWRVRYWWMDTESGAHWNVVAFCLSALGLLWELVRMTVAALQPMLSPPGVVHEQKAFYWWVVHLIIAIVAAVLSYALRPKIPKTPPAKVQGPTVEDGLCVDDDFGEVWKDPQILAWKVVKTEKIKSKTGGKK